MWEEFGFRENPYDHLPIAANEEGARLLVGREEEVKRLSSRIKARNATPTLEGDIGIGKTSIISVSAFRLEQEFWKNGGTCFLALEKPFQLEPGETADDFTSRAYQSILMKIHLNRKRLVDMGMNVGDTGKLYNWLTSAQYNSGNVNVGPIGGGLSVSPNVSEGFSTLGFQNQVNQLLKKLFPSPKQGGVICTIDNLELLEKSTKAKATLEAMRDKILTAHGLIWVICGARGIVRGVASSPRLQGYLSKPMMVSPLPVEKLDGLIDKRVKEYMISDANVRPPVEQEGFTHIFRVCNENLRTAFKFCADYSEWVLDNGYVDEPAAQKIDLLETWLANEAAEYEAEIKLTPKPWEVFDKIVDLGGSIAPSDHGKFGYDTPMAMRPQIKTLEEAGLVDSTTDETDKRRRTISLTPKGWLINYSRRGYPENVR